MRKGCAYLAMLGLVMAGGSALGQQVGPAGLPPATWFEMHLPEDLPALRYPEYADALDRAKMQLQAGRYRLALQTIAGAPESERGTLLCAESLVLSGRNEEAIKALATPGLQESARTVLLKAQAMRGAGDRAKAAELLAVQINKYPGDAALRLELASVQSSMGQLSRARETLEWFAPQIERWRGGELRQMESADELVTIARGIDQLAVMTGAYRQDMALHQDVLSMFVRAYDVLDRRNANAHVEAATFLLGHDDAESAQDELEKALTINPNHIGALVASGELALSLYDFDTCEKAIASIRRVKADHPMAQLLGVELLLLQRMPEKARQMLEPLVKRDPDNAELLAHLAACEALRFDAQGLNSILAEIDRKMPESSLAHTTAAAYLIPAFQFKDAAILLHTAIERTPHWNRPRNLLALAYMQQADMEKARPILEEARKLDPFNVETTNYMRLLDTLESYKLAESDHFAVRYSPADDPFIAREVLDYMEGQYPRITSTFGHPMAEKTIIELMPTSEDFAVRTTGKPWIGTIGASTGPVITMVSPRSFGKTNGAFDWCDVTRHEFVHTVTLDATGHRIPRWFTEGLAVAEQSAPLNSEQATRLSSAVLEGNLFPIRRLNWAFIRPQKKGDAPLAYAQSLWLCTYIEETFGHQKILDMFAGYAAGLSTEQVISKSLEMSTAQLDERFAKWAAEQVVRLGLDSVSQKQLKELKEKGEKLIADRDYPAALETWQKAYAVCASDMQVNQRLAGLYLHKSINQPEKAAIHLAAIDREQLHDNRYSLRLAKLYEQQNELKLAAQHAMRATQIDPYDTNARELLARIYEKAGLSEKADEQVEIGATILSLKK